MPLRFAVGAGVHMQRNKQIGIFRIGDSRAIFERNEAIVVAGQHDLNIHFLFQLGGKFFGNTKDDSLFPRCRQRRWRRDPCRRGPGSRTIFRKPLTDRARLRPFRLCKAAGLRRQRNRGRFAHRVCRSRILAKYIDDQPRWIRQHESVVRQQFVHVENDTDDVCAILADANLAQQAVVDRERLFGRQRQIRALQVDINARGRSFCRVFFQLADVKFGFSGQVEQNARVALPVSSRSPVT